MSWHEASSVIPIPDTIAPIGFARRKTVPTSCPKREPDDGVSFCSGDHSHTREHFALISCRHSRGILFPFIEVIMHCLSKPAALSPSFIIVVRESPRASGIEHRCTGTTKNLYCRDASWMLDCLSPGMLQGYGGPSAPAPPKAHNERRQAGGKAALQAWPQESPCRSRHSLPPL